MRPSYARFWMIFFGAAGAVLWWEQSGRAWTRRRYFLPSPPTQAVRTERHFVALLLPKITRRPGLFTFGAEDFERLLSGLKSQGYTTIGLENVSDFYFKGRPLPPLSVFIALDRDEPESVRLADRSLKKLRLRGAVCLRSLPQERGRINRHSLSRHAIEQMRAGGAWDVGRDVSPDPSRPFSRFIFSTAEGELVFSVAPTGFNGSGSSPKDLRMLRLRPGGPVGDVLLALREAGPRKKEFVDEFLSSRLGQQWVVGWGAASTARRRLALMPTPGRTGAAVFLTGTEAWRDVALEFTLETFKKNFWAYARYKDAGGYIRVGASDGYWWLQQRAGPLSRPAVLGRAPIHDGDLPARVRLVLKGDWALLYINGVARLGRALPVDPAVDRGRIHLGVFDPQPRAAFAAVDSVRAKPLGEKWVALSAGAGPSVLERLREELVEAGALSPRWLEVGADGSVSSVQDGRETLWSLAGYYRCRLIPLVDASDRRLDLARDGDALATELAARAAVLRVTGLNLLLSNSQRAGTARFLGTLREKLHADRRRLWVTSDDPLTPAWSDQVDGILRPAGRHAPGVVILALGPDSDGAFTLGAEDSLLPNPHAPARTPRREKPGPEPAEELASSCPAPEAGTAPAAL